ncbi:glycosyl hydrolase-related protein [Streptomyces sp. FXJ1.4098]|nr:glycosyl hydrolase-related protein [Streptomyces sp. FXJ1.4098]
MRCGIAFGHTVHTPGDGEERAAQRWIHVDAPTWTVGFAGDVTHGHDVVHRERCDGGTDTTLRHTLLRAPHSPDPHADRGVHRFRHTVRPGATVGDAVADGYRLDMPLRLSDGASSLRPLVRVDHPDVVVETVKLAEDRSGDVVVRLYESGGSAARTTLTADFAVAEACTTDLLEENAVPDAHDGPHIHLKLRPFEIRTLRISRAQADEEPLGA